MKRYLGKILIILAVFIHLPILFPTIANQMAPFGRFVIIGWLLSEVHETQVRSVHHSEPHVWTKRKKERAAGPLRLMTNLLALFARKAPGVACLWGINR